MAISFADVQFPTSISQGATGGPRFSTTVQTLSSGFEHRNINWKNRRGEWDVATGLRTQEQVEELLDFFHARNGKAWGFRFKDWSDYRLPRWRNVPGDMFPFPVFFTTDGVTSTFQLVKVYADSPTTEVFGNTGSSYTRLIQKPAMSQIYGFFQNGAPLVPVTDFSLNLLNGEVTLSPALTATTGIAIAGYTEFDVPVRFDTDDMKITITTTENFSWGPIPIVEVRDID